jgi:homoserine kinase type II
MVLRAWPADGPSPEHLKRVHAWLFKLAELAFVPVPIRGEAGESLLEAESCCWEVTPWMPGAADNLQPPERAHLDAAFEGLAAVHRNLDDEEIEGESPGLRRRAANIRLLLEGGLDVLESTINRSSGHGAPIAETACRWLKLAWIVTPFLLGPLEQASARVVRLQPCLRDARPEHFLFEGGRLSGLVDFGAMSNECVSGDLARLCGDWLLGGDAGVRDAAIQAYERVRLLRTDEAMLIEIFERSSDLLIGERWLRWQFLENRRFDDPQAVARGLARGLARLERLASELGRPRFAG